LITKELLQEDIKEFADQFILDLAIPSVVGLKGTFLQPLILLKLIE